MTPSVTFMGSCYKEVGVTFYTSLFDLGNDEQRLQVEISRRQREIQCLFCFHPKIHVELFHNVVFQYLMCYPSFLKLALPDGIEPPLPLSKSGLLPLQTKGE